MSQDAVTLLKRMAVDVASSALSNMARFALQLAAGRQHVFILVTLVDLLTLFEKKHA